MNDQRGVPFEKGNRIGRGRPKGSRNKGKSPGQELLEQHDLQLVSKCLVLAAHGNVPALRLAMERISAARRDNGVYVPMSSIRTIQDVARAGAKVLRSVGRGKITPAEGEKIMSALESQNRIIDQATIESRMEKLEQTVAGLTVPRAA
jgi:hypothetical protein